MAIRFDQKFNREIARIVKNFNNKVRRIEKLDRNLLPNTVLVSDLKKDYSRRSDLKRRLRELQKFSERGSETIIEVGELTTTRYQFQLDKQRAALAKRNLTRQIREVQKVETSTQGLKSDYLQNLQYRRNYLNLKIKDLSKSQLKTRAKIIDQEENLRENQETFYSNIFQMLFRSAYQAGISQDRMLPLLNKLKQFTPYQLSQAVETHGVFKDFLDKYGIFTGVAQTTLEGKKNKKKEEDEDEESDIERAIENLDKALPRILSYYQ